jgi:hypothetical protein
VLTVQASDTDLQRAVWVLAAAVVGLLVREAWAGWTARNERRAQDRAVLSALLRETASINALAVNILRDVASEQEMLQAGRWRLKPHVTLPGGVYDLVRDRPPAALLGHRLAMVDLMRLQVQCGYTNALAAAQQRWKSAAARGQVDQVETISSFNPSIVESATTVVERCERVAAAVREAGKEVGGLNLLGPPTRE